MYYFTTYSVAAVVQMHDTDTVVDREAGFNQALVALLSRITKLFINSLSICFFLFYYLVVVFFTFCHD
jgi:hypothetical protein